MRKHGILYIRTTKERFFLTGTGERARDLLDRASSAL
jgi:hypothetical protein